MFDTFSSVVSLSIHRFVRLFLHRLFKVKSQLIVKSWDIYLIFRRYRRPTTFCVVVNFHLSISNYLLKLNDVHIFHSIGRSERRTNFLFVVESNNLNGIKNSLAIAFRLTLARGFRLLRFQLVWYAIDDVTILFRKTEMKSSGKLITMNQSLNDTNAQRERACRCHFYFTFFFVFSFSVVQKLWNFEQY